MALLNWHWLGSSGTVQVACLGQVDDGVDFIIQHMPSCYRRGPYRLLVEVRGGVWHHAWGCFDHQDQPMRYYHSLDNCKDEAERIAQVLLRDRQKVLDGPMGGQPCHSAGIPEATTMMK
jgi:hypothetical protein